jgi:hypothetical protein
LGIGTLGRLTVKKVIKLSDNVLWSESVRLGPHFFVYYMKRAVDSITQDVVEVEKVKPSEDAVVVRLFCVCALLFRALRRR